MSEPAAAEPEAEVFYTFTWGGLKRDRGPRREGGGRKGPRNQQSRGDDQGKGGPRKKGKGPRGKKGDQGPKEFKSAPPRREKKIDPDNPFAAALSGFKAK